MLAGLKPRTKNAARTNRGHTTELTVPFEGEDFDQIRQRFIAEYFKTYGYRDATPIELMKASPAAAAVPARNAVGRLQNSNGGCPALRVFIRL